MHGPVVLGRGHGRDKTLHVTNNPGTGVRESIAATHGASHTMGLRGIALRVDILDHRADRRATAENLANHLLVPLKADTQTLAAPRAAPFASS